MKVKLDLRRCQDFSGGLARSRCGWDQESIDNWQELQDSVIVVKKNPAEPTLNKLLIQWILFLSEKL